ncbi:MAG: hypothetical protein PX636_12360 [Microcystis sp. M53598_WE2]|jgi:hypothetical protein|nr:hypothetical protein [Microcystis sp. M53598_WE2]MDJ0671749.1 hypothetical protein [Microcystis sp. M53598_WE2]
MKNKLLSTSVFTGFAATSFMLLSQLKASAAVMSYSVTGTSGTSILKAFLQSNADMTSIKYIGEIRLTFVSLQGTTLPVNFPIPINQLPMQIGESVDYTNWIPILPVTGLPGVENYKLTGQQGAFQGKVTKVKTPESTSNITFLALGTLGAASTIKRKLKPSQSTEKETTKVS